MWVRCIHSYCTRLTRERMKEGLGNHSVEWRSDRVKDNKPFYRLSFARTPMRATGSPYLFSEPPCLSGRGSLMEPEPQNGWFPPEVLQKEALFSLAVPQVTLESNPPWWLPTLLLFCNVKVSSKLEISLLCIFKHPCQMTQTQQGPRFNQRLWLAHSLINVWW